MLQIQKKMVTQTCEVEVISITKNLVAELTLAVVDAKAFIDKTCACPIRTGSVDETRVYKDYSSATLLRGYDCNMNRKALTAAIFIIEMYDQIME